MMAESSQCGCCDGIEKATPATVENRPGLSAIAYRVGTHASFKESMLAELSTSVLQALKTREDDDFSIALIDAWAVVADILTFYQERIANENYLRTATEPVSLAQLAALIGYTPRPGLAAGVALAFTMEDLPAAPAIPGARPAALSVGQNIAGVPSIVPVDAGTKVQSLPGPGEQPQIFESIEGIKGRPEWNALRPRLHAPYSNTSAGAVQVRLKGLVNSVQAGDTLLLVDFNGPKLNRVSLVTQDNVNNVTTVVFEHGNWPQAASEILFPGVAPPDGTPLSDALIHDFVLGRYWDQLELEALAAKRRWPLDELAAGIKRLSATQPPQLDVFAMKIRASLFGHNAPQWESLPAASRYGEWIEDANSNWVHIAGAYGKSWIADPAIWYDAGFGGVSGYIDLDNVYPGVVAGNWIALVDPIQNPSSFAVQVTETREVTRSGYSLTARITRVKGAFPNYASNYGLRRSKVLAQSDQLPVADLEIADDVADSVIMLDHAVFGLRIGQRLVISGERSDKQGVLASEIVTISELHLQNGRTRVSLLKGLAYPYVRETVSINANVAAATHGDTKQEILGSGDASQAFQSFALKQPPLTWISADTPSLSKSTLTVRVNGVEWHEVETLYGAGAQDRVYTLTTDAQGRTLAQFGDGITGARLPTGNNNVQATYRQGLGAAGNVKVGALNMLMSRPLGLHSVINPQPATGGEDPETVVQSRQNAPFTVRTLDRIVSLADYEDFARASAGIAKANVSWEWHGDQRIVFLTISGPDGATITPDSMLYNALVVAIQKAGDPSIPLLVASYRPVSFQVSATVIIDPERITADVLASVKDALRAKFSFAAREFATPVFLSDVIATMQNVTGVVNVNVTQLYRNGDSPGQTPPDFLLADGPLADPNNPLGAELLTIDAGLLTGIQAAI